MRITFVKFFKAKAIKNNLSTRIVSLRQVVSDH